MKTPWKHQQHGVDYLINRNGSGFLWYDIRTGKSFTTLLADRNPEEPVLILGPLTVLAGWITEIMDMGFSRDDIIVVRGTYNQKRNLLRSTQYTFYLLNYDVTSTLDVANVRRDSIIPITDWGRIIFDESYCLARGGLQKPKLQAEKGSQRTMYWLNNLPVPEGQKRVMLSGLPNPETVLDFASQYLIADGHYMGHTSYDSYIKAHWTYNKYNYSWEMNHPHHAIAVMEYVAANSCIVAMRDVHDVPENLYTVWDIPTTPIQEKMLQWLDESTVYKRHERDMLRDLRKLKPKLLCSMYNVFAPKRKTVKAVQESIGTEDPIYREVWEHHCQVQVLTPIIKFGFSMQVVAGVHPITKERIDENKTKYLIEWYKIHKVPATVFSRSRVAIEYLCEELNKNGIKSCIVHGGIDPVDRERLRSEFQNGLWDMFLGQTDVIKMGYNLSRADYIFYFSNDPSNNVRTQADGRTTHLTKSTPTSIIDLCTEGTRERDLVQVLRDKYSYSREFIKSPVNFLKGK